MTTDPWSGSSGGAAVAVMQTAEVGCGDHAAVLWRLNLSRHRRVPVQRLMGTRGVVQLGTIRPTKRTIVKSFIRGTLFSARGSLSDKRLAAPDW
jgi:hypothetical protein